MHIVAGTDHAVGFPELPRVLPAPGQDVPGAMRRAFGDTRVAAGRVRFAAIVFFRPGQQVHLGADRQIVVHGHVERHAEAMDQRLHAQIHAHQMMHVHPRHGGGLQHLHQFVHPLVRQVQHRTAVHVRHQQGGAASGGLQQQDVGAAGEPGGQRVDVALHTAAKSVRQHQHDGQPHAAEQRGGDGETEGTDGVLVDVARDAAGVRRIA